MSFERFKNKGHFFPIFSKSGAHVVIRPGDKGKILQILFQGSADFFLAHIYEESPRTWIGLRVFMGFHG